MQDIQLHYPSLHSKLGVWPHLCANKTLYFLFPLLILCMVVGAVFVGFFLLTHYANHEYLWLGLLVIFLLIIAGIFAIYRIIIYFTQQRIKAFNIIVRKADKGFEHAQFLLGAAYQGGVMIEKNPQKAVMWYKKSAGQSGRGNPLAMQALGLCYYYGWGVGVNHLVALQYLIWAEDLGIKHYPNIIAKLQNKSLFQ